MKLRSEDSYAVDIESLEGQNKSGETLRDMYKNYEPLANDQTHVGLGIP